MVLQHCRAGPQRQRELASSSPALSAVQCRGAAAPVVQPHIDSHATSHGEAEVESSRLTKLALELQLLANKELYSVSRPPHDSGTSDDKQMGRLAESWTLGVPTLFCDAVGSEMIRPEAGAVCSAVMLLKQGKAGIQKSPLAADGKCLVQPTTLRTPLVISKKGVAPERSCVLKTAALAPRQQDTFRKSISLPHLWDRSLSEATPKQKELQERSPGKAKKELKQVREKSPNEAKKGPKQKRHSEYSPVQMVVPGESNSTSVVYWDRLASVWEDAIQNSLREDRHRVIYKALDQFVKGVDMVVDLGCGTGNYLLALAVRAKRVIGIDISPGCIEVASQRLKQLRILNCELHVSDLGSRDARLHPETICAAAVVCTNVLISPDAATRDGILNHAYTMLRAPAPDEGDGGVLLLVVPSVESVQLEQQRHQQWVQMRRRRRLKRLPDELSEPTCEEDEAMGVFCRNGVRTKHFYEAELIAMLESLGVMLVRLEKVFYNWESVGLAEVGDITLRPFDWLAVAQRTL